MSAKQAAIGTNRITSTGSHDLEAAYVALKECLSEVEEESKQGHPFPRPDKVRLSVHVFLRALRATLGAEAELTRRARFTDASTGKGSRFAQAIDGILATLHKPLSFLLPVPGEKVVPPALAAVNQLRKFANGVGCNSLPMERILAGIVVLSKQNLPPEVRAAIKEGKEAVQYVVTEEEALGARGCVVLANWDSWERQLDTSSAGTVMEIVEKVADSLVGWVKEQSEAEKLESAGDGGGQGAGLQAHYAFRETSLCFEIQFSKERGLAPSKLLGAKYIRTLLMSPDESISVSELRGDVLSESDANPKNDTSRERLNKAKDELREQLVAKEGAKRDGNELFLAEAEGEIKKLTIWIGKETGLGGKARTDASKTSDSARSSVTQAIKAFTKKLGKDMPLFAQFVRDNIHTGVSCQYSPPDPAPEWDF